MNLAFGSVTVNKRSATITLVVDARSGYTKTGTF